MKKKILLLLILFSTVIVNAQPVKKVVIEHKTGTWAAAAPYGIVAMSNLWLSETDFIGISIHQGDPLTNTYYDAQSESLPGFDGGFPYACADRINWGHGSHADSLFEGRKTESPVAYISVTGVLDGLNLEITVEGIFVQDISGDWRFAAAVTEDFVTGTAWGYAQYNMLSGGGVPLVGAGHDWQVETNPVLASDMVYNHVARVMANDQYSGFLGSVTPVSNGETRSFTFNVTIDPSWNVNNLNVIGMLIEPAGTINNAAQERPGFLSIDILGKEDFLMTVFPNPTGGKVNLKLVLKKQSDVVFRMLDLSGNVLELIETKNLSFGDHHNMIDLSSYAKGVYLIETTVNNKTIMNRIVVQ